jgi:hypothetical protein
MDCTSKEISVSVLASTQTMKKKKMAQKYLWYRGHDAHNPASLA